MISSAAVWSAACAAGGRGGRKERLKARPPGPSAVQAPWMNSGAISRPAAMLRSVIQRVRISRFAT